MDDPITKAKWVLETKGITGIPAESLHDIADSEDIRYLYRILPNDPKLGGQLLYKGKQKGIIVNTYIDHMGRQNFTFAHELGHYFLEHPPSYAFDGQLGFWCTTDDVNDSKKPREIEANYFAVELLMPEKRFRLDMAGAPIDFDLIGSLANKYMVSKHACSNRILSLTRCSCIIILTKGTSITSCSVSKAAKGFLRKINSIPENTVSRSVINNDRRQKDFEECNAEKWLMRSVPNSKIYECTHRNQDSNVSMTILTW